MKVESKEKVEAIDSGDSASRIPIFAPIRNVEFDNAKVALEMELITDDLHHVAIKTDQYGVSEFTSNSEFEIAPEEVRLRTYRSDDKGIIDGEFGSYRVANLTYLPDHPKSRYHQTFTTKSGRRSLYLYDYPCPWHWVPDLEIPYIRQLVSMLPFEYVQLVRSVILLPPAIGPIHVDSPKDKAREYYQKGFASITLNVSGGGGELLFQTKNGIHTVQQSFSAWHFDPSTPHGTTEVTEPRFQLRIYGKLDSGITYQELMDLDNAVWS